MTSPEQYDKGKAGINPDLEQYFIDITISCPYEMDQVATYHQALFTRLDPGAMASFLGTGYRRNGNCVYSMHCKGCRSCIPIRLYPQDFKPNRNQRRVFKKNKDVSVGIAPLSVSKENINLLDAFLKNRFPGGRSTAIEYYSGFFISSISRCFEIRYRVKDKLIGVAIVDGSDFWLNAVYFYFDPAEGWRSPGTFNILYLIDFCQRHTLELLYLGYQINEINSMNYKANFKPHQLLIDSCWTTVKKETNPKKN